MDEQDIELVKAVKEMELQLWRAVMDQLPPEARDMLTLYAALFVCRSLLDGTMRRGPTFDIEQARQDLSELAGVEMAA